MQFHSLPHREALGAGAAGVGKSVVLLWEPLEQIKVEHDRCYRRMDHEHPLAWGESTGWALHLRRTYKELGLSIKRSLQWFPKIDPGARFVKDDVTMGMGWIFSSGYRYQFGHCMDRDDWISYQSFEYTCILYDELVTFLEDQYDGINTRLRSSDPVLGMEDEHGRYPYLKIRAMSNPVVARGDGEKYLVDNPYWVRTRFVDPAPSGRVTLINNLENPLDGTKYRHEYIYWPGKLSDNPNKSYVKQYTGTLLTTSKYKRKAFLEGDWYATPGAYFEEAWDKNIHIIMPQRIPYDWPVFRAMDWGFKKRGVIQWYALDEDENMIGFHEYSFRGKTASEVAKAVRRIEMGYGLWNHKLDTSCCTGPADSQLWERRGDDGKSKAETFIELGIPWIPSDKKSRMDNFLRIIERLQDHDNYSVAPGLMVFNTFSNLIKNLPTVQSTPADPDVPVDGGEDHDVDALGYACSYASRGRAGIGFTPDSSGDWMGGDDDEAPGDGLERGSYGY